LINDFAVASSTNRYSICKAITVAQPYAVCKAACIEGDWIEIVNLILVLKH
jgi:hypothetical protein